MHDLGRAQASEDRAQAARDREVNERALVEARMEREELAAELARAREMLAERDEQIRQVQDDKRRELEEQETKVTCRLASQGQG